ncbi:MAG: Gfo/Idh/MocA family oxidoreductase [Candidatus Latescibacterota bacterium]|nr:Gfo/Idh/MocA family oxidoreductase [Candidatus Latescibacterota bacterium]
MRFGLISGAHVHTPGYVKSIVEGDDSELSVVWDDMEDRGQHWAREAGALYVADLGQAAAADVDGFVVCAENSKHRDLLEPLIRSGKAVFCEKPLEVSASEARKAADLAREVGNNLLLGYFQPMSAEKQGVLQALRDGGIGKVTHARYRNAHHAAYGRWFDNPHSAWFTDKQLAGGGAFLDMGTHAVHLLRTLLGPMERVWAHIDNVSGIYPDVDDRGVAVIACASGALATVEAAWVQTGGPGGLEVTGSEGTICEDGSGGYTIHAPGENPVAVAPRQSRPTGIDRLRASIKGDLSADEIDDDLTCAVDAVAITEASYRSSESGTWETMGG